MKVKVKHGNATTGKTRRRSLLQYGSSPRERRNRAYYSPPVPPAPPAQAPAAASSEPQPWTQRLSIEIAPNSTAQAKKVRDALLGGKLVAAREEQNGTAIDSPLVAALSDAGWDEVEDAAISSVDGKEVVKAATAAGSAAAAQTTKSLSGGAVAGVVIGALLLALALAALGAFVMARRRRGGGGIAFSTDPKKKERTAAASWFASSRSNGTAQSGKGNAAAAASAAPSKLDSARSTDLEVAAAKAAALAPRAAPPSRHSSSTDLASHKLDIEAASSPSVEEKGRRFRKLFGGSAAATTTAAATSGTTKEAPTHSLSPPQLPQPNYEPAEPGLGTEQVVAGARRDLASIAAAGVSSLRKLAAAAAVGGGGGGGGEKAGAARAGGGPAAAAAAAVAASAARSQQQQQQQAASLSSREQQQPKPVDDRVSLAESAIVTLAARGTPYAGKYSLSRQGPSANGSNSKHSSNSRPRPTTLVFRATELAPPGRNAAATFYLSDEQFRHEASLAAKIPPGDVTPEVLDAYAAGDAPGARSLPACIVAEAADYSLEEWPERRARAPDAVQRRAVLALVARAVAGAHARGVVHGSLCPSALLWFSGANAMRLGELSRWAPAGGRAPLHSEPR